MFCAIVAILDIIQPHVRFGDMFLSQSARGICPLEVCRQGQSLSPELSTGGDKGWLSRWGSTEQTPFYDGDTILSPKRTAF
jgi:hypothetical protein